jgi:ABC-2 type transport system ATP-binding protein
MDETRTILVTTHQVEEVENLLTDVLFIDQGRIVVDSSMDDIANRYAAVAVAGQNLDAARAERPFFERRMLGKVVLYYEQPNLEKLAQFGDIHTPSVADLFVAKLSKGEA